MEKGGREWVQVYRWRYLIQEPLDSSSCVSWAAVRAMNHQNSKNNTHCVVLVCHKCMESRFYRNWCSIQGQTCSMPSTLPNRMSSECLTLPKESSNKPDSGHWYSQFSLELWSSHENFIEVHEMTGKLTNSTKVYMNKVGAIAKIYNFAQTNVCWIDYLPLRFMMKSGVEVQLQHEDG